MNISDQIIAVLDELCKKFGIAINWSSQNVAPYLEDLGERIVRYEIIGSGIWIAVSLLLFLITWFMIRKYQKAKGTEEEDYREFFLFLGLCAAIPACGVILCQIFDILTAIHIPEKIVADLLTSYIDKGGLF